MDIMGIAETPCRKSSFASDFYRGNYLFCFGGIQFFWLLPLGRLKPFFGMLEYTIIPKSADPFVIRSISF